MNWAYIWQRYKIPIIAVLVVLIVLAGLFGTLTRVKAGTKTVCKYDGMVLKDNTYYIITFRWNASNYTVKIINGVCAKHKRLEALYKKAKKALKDNKLDEAAKIFQEIKAEDAGFLDINTELARIDEAQSSGGAGGTTPGDPGNNGNGGTNPPPPVDLAKLLPDNLEGYTASTIDQGADFADRGYTPKSQKKVLALLVTVHKTSGQSASEQFVANVDKVGFPNDGRVTTVNGYAAYFGTDGRTYATLAWAKVNIVYEMQFHSATGNPVELFDDAINLAKAFN